MGRVAEIALHPVPYFFEYSGVYIADLFLDLLRFLYSPFLYVTLFINTMDKVNFYSTSIF